MSDHSITLENINTWQAAHDADPARRVATIALHKCYLDDVAQNGAGIRAMRHNFSLRIKTLPVTNQKASGRCWLFAATNVLRERIAAAHNLENFELSQSWLAFWDKFERANYMLESIIATADQAPDSREVMFILQTGVHDGGQWDMFANIVRKYGIVPKDAFDETAQTVQSRAMNRVLNRALKVEAIKLRNMIAEGKSEDEIQAHKNDCLKKIYSFLVSCFGVPPKTFDLCVTDKDNNCIVEKGYTPITFRDKYVGDLLDNIVSVIHAPTADKPYHKCYTIRLLGNVVGGQPVRHLNLTMDELKAAVIRQMEAGKVVWFGSDVGPGRVDGGIWDEGSLDEEGLTGLDLTISKADGLDYSFSAMNHAMVLTGVHIEDGKPTRWRIENSWGDDKGDKGYYICSDSWFDRYVYQAAIEKEYLGDCAKYVSEDCTELAPWDPMGTLAE